MVFEVVANISIFQELVLLLFLSADYNGFYVFLLFSLRGSFPDRLGKASAVFWIDRKMEENIFVKICDGFDHVGVIPFREIDSGGYSYRKTSKKQLRSDNNFIIERAGLHRPRTILLFCNMIYDS